MVRDSDERSLYWPGSGLAEMEKVGGTEFHRYREKQSPLGRCIEWVQYVHQPEWYRDTFVSGVLLGAGDVFLFI